jgi:RNA polymerase sigma-70 factor, ECF subfamily
LNNLLLIEGLRRRDKVVFDYIFNYYYSSLCVFSMQYMKDRNEIEDLVQDFFVSLWINAPNLQINSSLKSYLFAGIKNRCMDFQKHQKVIEKYRSYILYSVENNNNAVDHYFAESELHLLIQKSLAKLSPRCREVFEMSRLKGLSNQEISEQLRISKRTVELQISNSLKVLKKDLAEYLPFWFIVCLID